MSSPIGRPMFGKLCLRGPVPGCTWVLLVGAAICVQGSEPGEAERLFALKVAPLLRDKCLGCHGEEPDDLASGFDLRSREAVLRGGDAFGEEVLVPRKASESYLYSVVRRDEPDYEMPPKEAERLTREQTWWIRDWIDGGAP